MATEAARRPAATPGVPQTVIKGAYQITAAFRETDHAFIFRGRLLSAPGELAIKILKETFTARPDFLERYSREMEATQGLPPNPGMIKIHDVDYVSGRYCVVTDFFPSVSLDEVIGRRQVLPLAMLLRILDQVARIVGFAHREGLPHRHLKLDDILVSPETHEVRATHFSFPRLVVTAVVPGRNQATGIGSDLLELGVLLFRLVCFDYPFRDRTEIPELVADRLEAGLKRSYPELVPEDVQALVTLFIRATTRDLDRRLSRYEEFIDELALVASHCKPLVEKKKQDEARDRRELLETAFDTVAALRGDFHRPPALGADPALDSPELRALAAPPAPGERDTRSNHGLLVWGRDDEGAISFESPLVTGLLITTIVALLVGLTYRLFF